MNQDQKGYTLIESLIVLSIFMILSCVTAISLKPQFNMVNEQIFISQLKADLYFAQQYAISHQQDVTVNFVADQQLYQIYEKTSLKRLVERKFPYNFQVISGSLPLYFRYLPGGNVDRFGSFFIQTAENRYRVTVLIGRGRFYVVKE
ncbi:competence type IV pilus minor pilin ComGD [Bacillus sp. MRMR6]|uniref:competence type IV pilus minor pilin ComGD n=1 Tax=Bacillus sp. MRMR6 TaxID=1928617 RepID=UPI000951BBE4|nr:competence type IV pilus minor pilin ComGD [Bacillus sp. MRMR6]OLS41706.1 competence protein ComG [Bacillus sp. MRMR6]